MVLLQVIEKAKNLGSGFVHIGMKPGQSSFIGIYAQNCAEVSFVEMPITCSIFRCIFYLHLIHL